MTKDDKLHPAARLYAQETQGGQMDRREFLTRTTALGVSIPAAYGLLGLGAPASAQDAPAEGGTLRMSMQTRATKDPRLADWSEVSNFQRGWLEYMVEYNNDGSIRGMLLESWESNADATEYVIHVRPGVTWNDGTPFTAQDVAFNFERWADGSVEGNSMAGRLLALVDEATGGLREGALTIVDDMTIRLVLATPDISLIAGLADYPAGVVKTGYDGSDPVLNPIGTGPFLPETNEVGVRQVLVRNPDHQWWGTAVYGGPYLDRIEYIDYGTDPSAQISAVESGEIDLTYQTTGDFIDILDSLGWIKTEALTASTITVRFNQEADEFKDVAVRRALQLAVDNAVVLELGYNGLGLVAENHHVCPIHPEYAELPPPVADPAAALAAIEAAGMADFEFELISLDDSWQASTCDAVAAQIRDAGIAIKRTVLPGSTFWNDWLKYPFSATEWAMRPLGVQVLAIAYKSGVPWNETAFSNEEFDTELARALSIADVDQRREVMARIEAILQEQGVVIQPYWRSLYNHAAPGVAGTDVHPSLEHHHYKWSIAAA